MKNLNKLLFTVLIAISGISGTQSFAQIPTISPYSFLSNLKKLDADQLKDKQLSIDGVSTPIYIESGEKVDGQAFMTMYQTGEFMIDVYGDNQGEVKAILMRKASSVEKEMLTKAMSNSSEAGLAIGTEAPDFEVKDIKGKSYKLSALKDKVVVLNFWFTACKPCIMEIPELNEIVAHYKDKEVVFLAMGLDSKEDNLAFLKKKAFDYHLIPDSKDISELYTVFSYPTHYVIGKENKVVFTTSGLGPTTIKDLTQSIENALQ